MTKTATDGMAQGRDPADGARAPDAVVMHASRRKASFLVLIAAFVVLAFVGVDWFSAAEPAVQIAAILVGVGLAGYFTAFALALFFRRQPVFEVDADGIALPVGLAGLVRLPWAHVERYAVVSRRFRLLPFAASTAFGLCLTSEGKRRGGFSDAQVREFKLNQASMGVDVILTHWFSPVPFEAIREAAGRFRPDLDATDPELRP